MPVASKWDNAVRYLLQRDFLEKLSTEAPIVLESLAELVPFAKEIAAEHSEEPFWPAGPKPKGKLAELWAWAERFHFQDEWIVIAAISTLREWFAYRAEGQKEPVRMRLPGLAYYVVQSQFTTKWDPMWEDAPQFRKRAIEDLDAFIDSETAKLRQEGYAHANEKREPQHLVWTIRYQVLGQSFPEIAESLPSHRDAPDHRRNVEKAIKSTARLIDLTLRKGSARRRRAPRVKPTTGRRARR